MSIEATVKGNLLENPSQRTVLLKSGERRVTNLRVMSDVWRNNGEGEEPTQDEARTRPVAITIWNERLGDSVMATMRVGMRIEADGELFLHEWHPDEAQRASGKSDLYELRLDATDVALKLNRVESIQMRTRQPESAQ